MKETYKYLRRLGETIESPILLNELPAMTIDYELGGIDDAVIAIDWMSDEHW